LSKESTETHGNLSDQALKMLDTEAIMKSGEVQKRVQ